jgi:hypothetical protein
MEVEAWADFAVAAAGASAALTGLVFVAVSINLARILQYPDLPVRTGQTLVLFLAPLFISLFVLIGAQTVEVLGVELAAAGVVVGAIMLALSRRPSAEETKAGFYLARLLPSLLVAACTLVAGLSLIAGAGGGLLWIVPAVLVAFLGGVGNAWVLLIEIQR